MINIYVGNMPYSTTEAELKALFEKYAPVMRVAVVIDRETGRSRGFGFVEMQDVDAGRKAITELAGADFNGRNLTVREAEPRKPKTPGVVGSPSGSAGASSDLDDDPTVADEPLDELSPEDGSPSRGYTNTLIDGLSDA